MGEPCSYCQLLRKGLLVNTASKCLTISRKKVKTRLPHCGACASMLARMSKAETAVDLTSCATLAWVDVPSALRPTPPSFPAASLPVQVAQPYDASVLPTSSIPVAQLWQPMQETSSVQLTPIEHKRLTDMLERNGEEITRLKGALTDGEKRIKELTAEVAKLQPMQETSSVQLTPIEHKQLTDMLMWNGEEITRLKGALTDGKKREADQAVLIKELTAEVAKLNSALTDGKKREAELTTLNDAAAAAMSKLLLAKPQPPPSTSRRDSSDSTPDSGAPPRGSQSVATTTPNRPPPADSSSTPNLQPPAVSSSTPNLQPPAVSSSTPNPQRPAESPRGARSRKRNLPKSTLDQSSLLGGEPIPSSLLDQEILRVMREENGDAVNTHKRLVETSTLHPRNTSADVFQRYQDLMGSA